MTGNPPFPPRPGIHAARLVRLQSVPDYDFAVEAAAILVDALVEAVAKHNGPFTREIVVALAESTAKHVRMLHSRPNGNDGVRNV